MLKISARFLSRQEIQLRTLELGLLLAPLGGAYCYSHTSYSSPFFCPFRTLTGIPCPGCGMTRSFLAIAKGNLSSAIGYNLFGPILFIGLTLAVMHLFVELLCRRKIDTIYTKWMLEQKIQLISLGSLLIYHGIRLILLARSGELFLFFTTSPLGKLLL
jgi:hypothetical protein